MCVCASVCVYVFECMLCAGKGARMQEYRVDAHVYVYVYVCVCVCVFLIV